MPGLRTFSLTALLLWSSLSFAQEKPLRQIIDAEIKAGWQKEKIAPAVRSTDAVFLRRVYLDLSGGVPTYDETTAFLKDGDSAKRAKVIDKLLADPRYATQQAHFWDLVLFGRHPQNIFDTRKHDGFTKWMAGEFAKNTPYDKLVQKILTADEEGAEMFYVQYRNAPEEAATAVARLFLGTQLQCARCHDHPFENWTQKDFFGMAGFFVRLVIADNGGPEGKRKYKISEKSTGDVLFAGSVKDLKPGQKGDPVKPRFLGSKEDLKEPATPKDFKDPVVKGFMALPKPAFSRKEKLVEWVAAKDNPYFAKAIANRIWSQYMGRGFVHPVDDLGSRERTPSHPELLKAIADGLVAHKYDLKWLMREILNSEAYQVGDAGPMKEALPELYERARVRPLSAEELMTAIGVATGHGEDWAKKSQNATVEYMLRYFGEPTDGQGHFQGSLAEHLFLNNAPQIRSACQQRKGNLADVILTSKDSPEMKVDRLFLSILNRPPTAIERERFVKHLTSGDAKMAPQLVEDAIWALIACSEFRFNH
ncbi:MAG: DUF1549 domain-containing protein [Planctomycetes bacterium]|nr:DUF1549 domain-containing protein [Planctomycetota bacterium]